MSRSGRVLTALRCRLARARLEALRWVFRFDRWHSSAPYHCRPYKRVVVDLASSVKPHTVVEVGCGLGDIVSRVRATERFGFDIDPKVIRAAKFLHPRHVRWIHSDTGAVGRCIAAERVIDCLIMVNWIHNLAADELAALILPLLSRTKYLLLDAVDADAPSSYRFRHDFAFLAAATRRVAATRVQHEPRSFLLLQVIK